MAKTFIEHLLCTEQYAKCCYRLYYLIPAVVMKGTFYYSSLIAGELNLRQVK